MTTSPTAAAQRDGRSRRWDYESWTRRSERPLLAAALVFLGLLVTQALTPERPRAATLLLRTGEMLVWAAFAVDYAVRFRLAPDRRHYVRHHLLDLLALAVPFLRPLRLVTLVGVFGTSARRAGDDIRNCSWAAWSCCWCSPGLPSCSTPSARLTSPTSPRSAMPSGGRR
ncbi:MAG: hypothetical protein M3P93_08750 [Actinomycetota bacterium]|nr:hypothetical protein [Actinomycetota bacterium]